MTKTPGFWEALWLNRRDVLGNWDVWLSLALSLTTVGFASDNQIEKISPALGTTALGIAAALLGVILAGLALIVAFLNEDYVRILAQSEGGVEPDFFPFWLTAGIATAAIVFSGALFIASDYMLEMPRRGLVFAVIWTSLWSLFATLNLVALVRGHGINRATQIILADRMVTGISAIAANTNESSVNTSREATNQASPLKPS